MVLFQEFSMQIFLLLFHASAHFLLLFPKGGMPEEQSMLREVFGCFHACKKGENYRCTHLRKAWPGIFVCGSSKFPVWVQYLARPPVAILAPLSATLWGALGVLPSSQSVK